MKKTFIPLLMFLSLLASDAAQASDTRPAPAEPSSSNEQLYLTTMADVRRIAKNVALGELSFQPERECRKPPKAPPDRLLKRRYNPRLLPNLSAQSDDIERYIHRIDLNGDGICDWLREGAEPSRYDSIDADPRDFLFLGTPHGWRYPGLTEDFKRNLEKEANPAGSKRKDFVDKPPKRHNPGFLKTLTAFVFEKNNPKPFVVAYDVAEDRNRLVFLAEYKTFRWNSDLDNFDKVPLKQHAAVLLFLQKELCGKEPANIVPNRDVSRFASPIYGEVTLCEKEEDTSAKK